MRSFQDIYGSAPAVSTFAPGRVNLLGEHTDYNEGLVLPAAIPQRTTVALAKNGRDRFRVYSVEIDRLCEFGADASPTEHFASYVYGCVREFAAAAGSVPPLDIHIHSTVPIGVGLSSSAALEVATLRALRELMQAQIDDVKLALMAQRAEVDYAGVNCGILDQMAASLGSENALLLLDTRTLDRRLIPLPAGAEILVLHSGVERSLAATGYNTRRDECSEAARLLGLASLRDATLRAALQLPAPYRQRARHVITENERVMRAAAGADAAQLGALMNASHASLRDDYQVSTPAVDLLVSLLQADERVYGAKITGGGFGGACVALCRSGSASAAARKTASEYAKHGQQARMLVPAEVP